MGRMTRRKTDLHENALNGCLRCSQKLRDRNTTENGYCKVVKGCDGLDIKCVGGWEREKVENQMRALFVGMSLFEREIVKLTALRDALLPVLMNGQVKVG